MDWVNLKDVFSAVALQNPPSSVEFKERMAPSLTIHPKDFIQPKEMISAFKETNFQEFLVGQGIERLYFAGFLVSQCLQQSAFDADKDLFKRVLLSDLASDGLDQPPTESQLNLYRYKGVEVINSFDLKL